MNVFLMFDEYSDLEDEQGVRNMSDIVRDVLAQPFKTRPVEERWLGGKVMQQ